MLLYRYVHNNTVMNRDGLIPLYYLLWMARPRWVSAPFQLQGITGMVPDRPTPAGAISGPKRKMMPPSPRHTSPLVNA